MGHGMRWDGMGWDGMGGWAMGKEVLSFSRFIHTGGVLPPFSGIHYWIFLSQALFAGYVWLPPG